MKDPRVSSDISRISHIALVITITIFSVLLIFFDILLGWDYWMVPIIVLLIISVWAMHITNKAPENHINIMYSSVLMLEMFYYCNKITSIYDATPVVIIIFIVLSLTGSSNYIRICLAVSYLAYFVRLFSEKNLRGGLDPSKDNIVHFALHLVFLFAAAVCISRAMDIRGRSEVLYRKRIETVEEENTKANNFLANVSHEIRTPINAVIGLTEVIMDQITDKDIKEDIESVNDAGNRIADQIADILDYTEIDMKRLVVNNETYNISSLISELADKCRTIMRPEVEVIFDVDTSVPATLIGDVSKIKRILWHLISNGIKFTKSGGLHIKISAINRHYGINLHIVVTDTGVGMSENEREFVFEKFYQSDAGRTRTAGGLGLGLSIAHGFVKSMGGFMTIDSTKDVGTVVSVSIPQQISDNEHCMKLNLSEMLCLVGFFDFSKYENPSVRSFYDSLIKNLIQGLGAMVYRVDKLGDLKRIQNMYNITHLFVGMDEYYIDPAYIESLATQMEVMVIASKRFDPPKDSRVRVLKKPFCGFPIVNFLNSYTDRSAERQSMSLYCPGISALVVDDERLNLLVAEGLFKKYGMVVTTVMSGQDAVNLCEKQMFDLIFMDYMMPEMDGIEAMKLIRGTGDDRGKNNVFIALTANAVSSAREMFMKEGFNEFIPKPIEIADLERVLRRVLPKSAIVTRIQEEDPSSQENNSNIDSEWNYTERDTSQDDILRKLDDYGIDTKMGLKYCQNDVFFYKTLLQNFVVDYNSKMPDIKELYTNKEWHDYTIRVHALKSASKMIGQEELSELSKRLEDAAKSGDTYTVEAGHEKMLQMYTDTVKSIVNVFELKDLLEPEENAEYEVLEFKPE